MPTKRLPSALAAVDLGSNSFHLVVARPAHGRVEIIDRLKEPVRLAGGLQPDGTLSDEAMDRAIAALERFGQLVAKLRPGMVRAVGTNTLRRARPLRRFLERCQEALGHPVEVISGQEEARLIHLGVAHDLYQSFGRRLVVDIGGGSTELVVGEGFEVVEATSLFMGCVGFTRRYFEDGRIDAASVARAVLAARVELEPWERRFRSLGWQVAVGSSGTALAIESILRENGWSERRITPDGLRRLEEQLIKAGRIDRLALRGLSATRAPVIVGGACILRAIVDALEIREMATSQGALREGLLHDLLGRIAREDVRDRTVQGFVRRFGVDREQAGRVERTVLDLHAQVAESWGLDSALAPRLLAWAAQLHEIGLTVAYSGHHRHGAYLATHSEMAGFSRGDQELLACLIRFHRRKILVDELAPAPLPLPPRSTLRLIALLRIAVRLNRSRSHDPQPPIEATADGKSLRLAFPAGWLDDHPLTRADLEEEARRLKPAGIRLALD